MGRRPRFEQGSVAKAFALDQEWQEQGLCRKYRLPQYTSWWFPVGSEVPSEARDKCARCPVREQCLAFALAAEAKSGDRYGVWGGTSPAERKRMSRKNKEAKWLNR